MVPDHDRGSPVFSFIGFTGEVEIHGIAFASDDGPDGDTIADDAFWYSDIYGIVVEFGSITTN